MKATETPQKPADVFPYFAKLIRERARPFAYRQGDPALAVLYDTWRSAVNTWRSKNYPDLEPPPTLPGHSLFEKLADLADFCEKAGRPVKATGKGARRRRRRPPLDPKDRPLTAKQTEAVQIVGECKGNYAAAAKRLGIDRSSLKERYNVATRKLGKSAIQVKPKTYSQPHDTREQLTIAGNDDGPAATLPPRHVLRDRRNP